jgi:hypothetical protein
MIIPLGEYLPDLPDFNNPGATVAKNCIPFGSSYKSFPSQVVYSNALSAKCQGAYSTKDADGNTVNFSGDATKLYRMVSASYADVSKVGGYSTNSEEMWFFTRFNNLLLATNFADPIQTFTVNSSSNFANLAAGAPQARYITTFGSFVVVGNTFDASDGNVPHRVRWCALSDPTSWAVSASTLASYVDLNVSNGWVKQVVGSDGYFVVFQERAITRFTFIGSPLVFQRNEVESGKGTQASGSVIKIGNIIYYLGLDGFYAFDGNQSIPIGENKVNKTFWDEVDTNYLSKISVTAYPNYQVIIWAVPVSGNTDGRSNKFYVYNYSPNSQNRWSIVSDVDIEYLYTSLSEGYTLDSLDSLYASLDDIPFSLDSRVWTGDNYILSGFDSSHRQVNFTGSPRTALLETVEFQAHPGYRTNVSLVRPIVQGTSATVTVQMGTRNTLNSSVSYANAISTNSTGDCPVRSNSRFHRIRLNVSGGFDHIQGIDILKAAKVGER